MMSGTRVHKQLNWTDCGAFVYAGAIHSAFIDMARPPAAEGRRRAAYLPACSVNSH